MVISDTLDFIRLLFVSEKKPFLHLKSILGFYPHDIQLYQLALMHKSVAYFEREKGKTEKMNPKKSLPTPPQPPTKPGKQAKKEATSHGTHTMTPRVNNERLEFLGDAVLSAIVADILYKHYGNKQEGFLTTLRSKLVCRNTLNQIAVDLGLDKLIQHAGAVTTGHNSFMNGNAFEAFIGAIYLDRGYDRCYEFLEKKVFNSHLDIERMAKQELNFKSTLIEWCQKRRYTVTFTQEESRDKKQHNAPLFHSHAFIEGISCGTGDGYSKKESDQNAAKQALTRIKQDKELQKGVKNAAEHKNFP